MKYRHTILNARLLWISFCFLMLVSFSSCVEYVAGSIDDAKQRLAGNSADEDAKAQIGYNVMALIGGAIFGAASRVGGTHQESVYLDGLPSFKETTQPKGNLSFLSGLGFISKGYQSKDVTTYHTHLNYLEVPMYLGWAQPLSSGSVFAGAGPYFAYGIGGKIKGGNFSEPTFGDDNGGYKRFDVGITALAGYEFKNGITFHIAYDFGLANVAYADNDFTAHNRTLSFNVGYEISRLLKHK